MPRRSRPRWWPETIAEAVERLLEVLPAEQIEKLRDLPEDDLILAHFGLGLYIRNQFGLHQGNDKLLASASPDRGYLLPDPADVSSKIVEALWRRLQAEPSKR